MKEMNGKTVLIGLIALTVGGFAGWFVGSGGIPPVPPFSPYLIHTVVKPMPVPGAITQSQVDFQMGMRKLWEDHITWTRLYIESSAAELKDTTLTAQRLLKNQEDIGAAIKPYYGAAAGDQLTTLLKAHIQGAVDIINAAKAGNSAAVAAANKKWYANGDDIAAFLAAANPNWSKADLSAMMKMHLDLTLQEAVDRLGGKYSNDIVDYDEVHNHILTMSDALSAGIIKQFPEKFSN